MQIHQLSNQTFRRARSIAESRVDRLAAVAARREDGHDGPAPVAEMLGVSLVLVLFMALAIVL